MKKTSLIIVVALSLICFASTVYSAPVQWSSNGHYYEVIDVSAITWADAKSAAASSSYLGMTGYLATLTSAEENLWLTNTFTYGSINAHYFGGSQLPGSAPTENWSWVTGETWSYNNWAAGEPNDNFGANDETVLQFDHGPNADGGIWNDSLASSTSPGYIVEYSIVPEPISSILFVTGGTLLAGRRYMKRKKAA